MSIDINNPQLLLAALSQTYPPSTLLRDTFFPNPKTFITKTVLMDYKKGNRVLSPFIAKGGKSVNVERPGFATKQYEPPMMAPARIITPDDIEKRGFGEAVFSPITPEQRALTMRADDMAAMMEMNTRTIEWMCAQAMLYGEIEIKGYAEDGKTELIDTVTLSDWTQKLTLSGSDTWNHTDANGNYNADAFGNLEAMSQSISRNSGRVPSVAIMSYATKNLLLKNKKIMEILLVPNTSNLSIMSIAPRITVPGVVRIGIIESLNLELYAYDGIYQDTDGNTQQYIPDGYVIMGVTGRGFQLFGAITQLEDKVYRTYEGANIPRVWSDEDNLKIRLASKCVPIPEFIDDWYTLKAF